MATKKSAKSASTKKPAVPKTLTVGSRPTAKLPTIIRDLETALGRVGCRGCRSGIDKIVIGDPVMGAVK
jgi:hypothetical protein